MENDILNFGEVIFFIKTDYGSFALLKRMRCLPDGLFHDQVGYGDPVMDTFIDEGYLGMFFLSC